MVSTTAVVSTEMHRSAFLTPPSTLCLSVSLARVQPPQGLALAESAR